MTSHLFFSLTQLLSLYHIIIIYSLPCAFTCRTLCVNIMYMYHWEYIILTIIYIEQVRYAIGTFNFTCVVFSNSVHIHMY